MPQTFPYHYDWAENETNDDDNTSNQLDQLDKLDNKNPLTGPHFDYDFFRNETVMVGHTAYLKCKVKNIGNQTVSWVRHRDINLLTVGLNSYTSDNRFLSIREHDSEEWTLKVSIRILLEKYPTDETKMKEFYTMSRLNYVKSILRGKPNKRFSRQLKYSQLKDSGTYECQISTTPPKGYPGNETLVI